MAELSPMMKQYFKIKSEHEDQLLFFRLGDFYEMFYDDAITASKELELTLTGRDCGQEERAPMCGIPYHSCEAYIARLVKKGYKVAICEQMENPATAKGVVKREVIRVVTPGTIIENSMLDESTNNFICCSYLDEHACGLSFADISTGEVYVTELGMEEVEYKIMNEAGRFSPSEVVANSALSGRRQVMQFFKEKLNCLFDVLDDGYFESEACIDRVRHQFAGTDLEKLGLIDQPAALKSLGGLIAYLYDTQKNGVERLMTINLYNEAQFMNLDLVARRNLELTQTLRSGDKRGTLLWVLDKTKTAMGKRLIKSYIEQPVVNPTIITKRLGAVDELTQNNVARQDLMELLGGVFDMERLMTRIVYGSVNGRELKALAFTAEKLPKIKELLAPFHATYLEQVRESIDPLSDIAALIEASIIDDPPVNLKEGGVIRDGYSEELDALRDVVQNSKKYLANIEATEREKTGIKNLKIGFNRVFGYYIEVTKSFLSQVPEAYIRRQTLTNCERYITQELKELEELILGSKDKIIALETDLFESIRMTVASALHRIQATAAAVAKLDVFCSLGQVAVKNHYVRPNINLDGRIEIRDGRHPVVEALGSGPFVPNDVILDKNENRIAIITGPNMAGKSTYMRQVALIALMAQMGSFVPAQSADIGIVDGIFTRVGASDDLSAGQSTFMVEMSEVAYILKNATDNSLLILDEIGRGTSTYDGMSIARAVIEYIADKKKLGAKTLFATHYHELTELEDAIGGVKNYNIAAKKRGDDIIFLRRIVRGGADDSYGIEVSKLAGIPDPVIKRAHEVLRALETGKTPSEPKRNRKAVKQEENMQVSFAQSANDQLAEAIKTVDLNTITPIEALNKLYELKNLVQ
ncbi:DNA mismatch repair protein MutS [Zongyangia hominis]|uniref:DNA mismatch repair protein MutS n=1 Tax=Zongyangia hominis TaxID=2763677 RepID=A0A926IAZ7_9FIRM|nr:DNA mismatch repair protein MutS [Zongyangia hominis]MBC8569642.1 DNA mismatch repair protein MutS [Zongyangia hominis]